MANTRTEIDIQYIYYRKEAGRVEYWYYNTGLTPVKRKKEGRRVEGKDSWMQYGSNQSLSKLESWATISCWKLLYPSVISLLKCLMLCSVISSEEPGGSIISVGKQWWIKVQQLELWVKAPLQIWVAHFCRCHICAFAFVFNFTDTPCVLVKGY